MNTPDTAKPHIEMSDAGLRNFEHQLAGQFGIQGSKNLPIQQAASLSGTTKNQIILKMAEIVAAVIAGCPR